MIHDQNERSGKSSVCRCAKCGHWIVKRITTKILVQSGSYGVPKTLCFLCDRCLPDLLDHLEVTMPDDMVKPYTARRQCRKCFRFVGKYANYCPHCGDDLSAQAEEEK